MLLASEDWIPKTGGDYRDPRYGACSLGRSKRLHVFKSWTQNAVSYEVTLI